MATANIVLGFDPPRSSTDDDYCVCEMPLMGWELTTSHVGRVQNDPKDPRQGSYQWHNGAVTNERIDSFSLLPTQTVSNPHSYLENDALFHSEGYPTCRSDYCIGAPTSPDDTITALGLLLGQNMIQAEPQVMFGDTLLFDNLGDSHGSGSRIEVVTTSQSYGRNESMIHVGRCKSDEQNSISQAELAYSSTAQINPQGASGDIAVQRMLADDTYVSESAAPTLRFFKNTPLYCSRFAAQVPEDSVQGDSELTYHGPIHHASIELANSGCFGTQRRVRANHRSAPYTVVYHQERSRGQIYNGNIYGNVKNFNVSHINVGTVIQYLKDHAAKGAMHDSDERFPPPLCHPGTCEVVISRTLDWYGYQAGPRRPIMWIHAPAGYGKTAIAGTLAEHFEQKMNELNFNPLGATFFFWRTSQERNSPARFIVTLACQLAMSVPGLVPHVENVVRGNPMILTKALEVQLKKLIIEPFKALGDTEHLPNRLIIVDGVDECINSDRESRVRKKYAEDQEIVQIRVLDLIRTMASHQLPLSFLILSRPEAWIKQHIQSHQFSGLVEMVDLCEVGDHMQDVETFVRAELSRLQVADENLVQVLLDRAGGHMLFASTVVRHIDCPYDDPPTRLKKILTSRSTSNSDLAHSTPFSSLHELYRQILRSCPEGNHQAMIEVLEDLRASEATFNAAQVDVNRAVSILDHLSGRVPGAGMKAIRGLHAVLNLTGSANDDYLDIGRSSLRFFIHSSFDEFLLDARLSQEFHVDETKGYVRLLSGCLRPVPSIALDSKLDADHLRYAVVAWTPIWHHWVNVPWDNLPAPETPVLLSMFQKLLNVDLTTYFVHAFTDPHLDEVVYDPQLDIGISSAEKGNCIIAHRTCFLYDSEPLAKQAVSHIRASYENAVHHLLKTHHCTKHYNASFFIALTEFLFDFAIPTGEIDEKRWDSDRILHAMKTLKEESPEHFQELMGGVHKTYCDKLMERGHWQEDPEDLDEEKALYARYEDYILEFMHVDE
ncbi:hypothetical protein MD484_g5873, partial [Candolleomyces efflorescens]